jgi:lysophospholipase L1-like esterase
MSAASRSRLSGLCVLVTLFAVLLVASPAARAAQTDPVIQPPVANGTYLALGDSLAFGYQRAKVLACAGTGCSSPNTQFVTGYVDDFAGLFGASGLNVNTVNLGCPGETSTTLINATNATTGCTTYPFPIHSNHPGKTQLQAAVDVLQSIGKRVSPITIDIGANDVLALVGTCTSGSGISLSCVQSGAPAVFATINANLDTTLAKLREEGGVKHEIIVVGLYNPLYPAIFSQVLTQTGNPAAAAAAAAGTDALAAQLNSLQAATAAKYRALFADPLPVFNPPGNPTVEIGTICTLTAVCGPLQDIHATDAGYAAMANVIKQASGF